MKKVLMTVLVGFLSAMVFCLSALAQTQVPANVAAQDLLIKSEVETAVSLLQAIHTRHQRGEMTLGRYNPRRQCGSIWSQGCGGQKPDQGQGRQRRFLCEGISGQRESRGRVCRLLVSEEGANHRAIQEILCPAV